MIFGMRFSSGLTFGLAGALALSFVGGCSSAKKSEPATKAGIAWNTTYESALADAAKNKRPIVLDFYTDW